jgi:hypothetical protein
MNLLTKKKRRCFTGFAAKWHVTWQEVQAETAAAAGGQEGAQGSNGAGAAAATPRAPQQQQQQLASQFLVGRPQSNTQ